MEKIRETVEVLEKTKSCTHIMHEHQQLLAKSKNLNLTKHIVATVDVLFRVKPT